jgi:hypothetical protein
VKHEVYAQSCGSAYKQTKMSEYAETVTLCVQLHTSLASTWRDNVFMGAILLDFSNFLLYSSPVMEHRPDHSILSGTLDTAQLPPLRHSVSSSFLRHNILCTQERE